MKSTNKFEFFTIIILAIMAFFALGSACSDDEYYGNSYDEPFCIVYDKDAIPSRMTYSAYESQKEARENPLIYYTDSLKEDGQIDIKLYTKNGDRARKLCSSYGTYLVPKVCDNGSAYLYVEIKPLKEKTSESCNENQQKETKSSSDSYITGTPEKDAESTEQQDEESFSSDSQITEQQEIDEKNYVTEDLNMQTNEELKSENSVQKEIDASLFFKKFEGLIDEDTLKADLSDFESGKWDGEAKMKDIVCRAISNDSRSYYAVGEVAGKNKLVSASIDYLGELERYPSVDCTFVLNGHTIEEWKNFKLVGTWNVKDDIEILSIYKMEGNICVVAKESNGSYVTYKLSH